MGVKVHEVSGDFSDEREIRAIVTHENTTKLAKGGRVIFWVEDAAGVMKSKGDVAIDPKTGVACKTITFPKAKDERTYRVVVEVAGTDEEGYVDVTIAPKSDDLIGWIGGAVMVLFWLIVFGLAYVIDVVRITSILLSLTMITLWFVSLRTLGKDPDIMQDDDRFQKLVSFLGPRLDKNKFTRFLGMVIVVTYVFFTRVIRNNNWVYKAVAVMALFCFVMALANPLTPLGIGERAARSIGFSSDTFGQYGFWKPFNKLSVGEARTSDWRNAAVLFIVSFIPALFYSKSDEIMRRVKKWKQKKHDEHGEKGGAMSILKDFAWDRVWDFVKKFI